MAATTDAVSARDLVLLKDKLSAVLTTHPDDIEEVTKVAPAECRAVAQVLRTFHKGIPGARQWLAASMASLPATCWLPKSGHAGEHSTVHGVTGASLKYCTPGESFWDEAARAPQFRVREELCRALTRSLDEETHGRFGAMVQWLRLRSPNPERHKVLHDVALGDSIYQLESRFYGLFNFRETELRARHGVNPTVPTPAQAMRDVADAVQDELFTELLLTAQSASGKNSLLVQLLANLAANRFLLETAQQGMHAEQAKGPVVQVLSVLNEHNVQEVPEVETDEDIAKTIKDWFGPEKGILRETAAFNRQHDAATDPVLPYTVKLAGHVQEHYIALRGRGMGEKAARLQFDGPCNKLVFALVVTACAYAGATVAEELHGDSDRRHPAYPPRGKRDEAPSTHAMDLFCAAFGHIAFSNVGWSLSPRNVAAYSDALAYKRACMQELVFLTFKRLPAPGLLAVHSLLTRALKEESGAPAL